MILWLDLFILVITGELSEIQKEYILA